MTKQRRFSFHFAPQLDSSDVVLGQFLRQPDGKVLLLQALRAFWLPLAFRAAGKSDAEVKTAALTAVRLLVNHCLSLCLEFEIAPQIALLPLTIQARSAPAPSAPPTAAPSGSEAAAPEALDVFSSFLQG